MPESPPTDVYCPKCGAHPGEHCAGQTVGIYHSARYIRRRLLAGPIATQPRPGEPGWVSLPQRARRSLGRSLRRSKARSG